MYCQIWRLAARLPQPYPDYEGLCCRKDWDAIKNYLDLLDTDLATVDTVIKTGNPSD